MDATPDTNDAAASVHVPENWDVPDIFRRRLGDRVGRQRAMYAEGHLLLVLHAPPQGEEPERIGRLFWRRPDGVWKADYSNSGIKALDEHLDEFRDIIEKLDDREHAATTASEYFEILSALTPLYRTVRNLHLALQQARNELSEARDVINFRDEAYELERQADLLLQDSRNTLEFSIAKQTEAQARAGHHMAVAAHRLNVLVAFFFPIATLSAFFGTNMKHGLEEIAAPLPLIVLLCVSLICGVILKWRVTSPPTDEEANL